MRPSKTKPSTGANQSEGFEQQTHQRGKAESASLGTICEVLRQRLRVLAQVQSIALRNFDRDTFTRAHRAWLVARRELEAAAPADVCRTADMQWAGFEASQRDWEVTPKRRVSLSRSQDESFSLDFGQPGADVRGVA
jgi:hypothetical protein